jgi:hypothetical protein
MRLAVPDFEFTVVGRVVGPTEGDARLAVAKIVRQLDGYMDGLFTDCGYGVKPYPATERAEEELSRVSLTDMIGGPAKVTHPWEQGLWIFPEGHVLRPLEEQARARYLEGDNRPGARVRVDEAELWQEIGKKELMPSD